MEVVILAGGLGTRLRGAIGNEIPKCMAPVAGKPFLEYLLIYLTRFDVKRVILSVGHLREVIFDWVKQNGHRFPFAIDFAVEETPLGTGGGIKLALESATDTDVVVLNGDTMFNVDLRELMDEHLRAGGSLTLALKPMVDFDRYGTVVTDPATGRVLEFREKQHCASGDINGGVYVINREKIQWPDAERFSFETDVMEPGASRGTIYGYPFGDYFIDIGIPTDYAKANEDFKTLFA